jgi:O-antigen ligase
LATPRLAAYVAGAAAAALQLAGALKTAAPGRVLPLDLTLAAALLLAPSLLLLALGRRWRVAPGLALPLAGAALLWFWLVLAGLWTPSRAVAADKLREVALLAPLMLAAGLLTGADAQARRALAAASLAIGAGLALVALAAAWRGELSAFLLPGGGARPNYQLFGLAMATAAALAALAAAEARAWPARLAWLGLLGLLALAALLPGGRTALLALLLGAAVAPALRHALAGRGGVALLWLAPPLLLGAALAALMALRPAEAEGLRTLERLAGGEAGGIEVRLGLWREALGWAGQAAPFGLGPGGFAIAAGHGDWRGLHPHSHPVEVLAEGGLPGLAFWLLAFAGGAAAMAVRLRAVAPGRAARIAALVLPVGLSVLVSSDLGNRMAWFALGLALSLGLTAREAGDV